VEAEAEKFRSNVFDLRNCNLRKKAEILGIGKGIRPPHSGEKAMAGYFCSCCGEFHQDLPMSYGAEAPYWYDVLPESERPHRAEKTADLCILDGSNFFVRGVVEIPVRDSDEHFVWGVWVSLSRDHFVRMVTVWDSSDRETEPPRFGWFATALPGYPTTLNLRTHVHTRPLGLLPSIELEPTDHPLAVEQRSGITWTRIQELAEIVRHT